MLTLIPSDDRRDGFFITINNGEFELYQSLELEDVSEDVADIFELCDEESNSGYAKKVFSTKNFKEIVWTIHHLANRYTGDDFVLTIPLSKEAFIDIPYLDDISVSGKINVRRKLTEEELQNLNSVKSWARKMNKIAKKLAEENGLD